LLRDAAVPPGESPAVAGGLAILLVAIFTDSTCREKLLEELTSEMRRGFKDRGE
jgi:hypothetical protein